jgi:hypothetical protein
LKIKVLFVGGDPCVAYEHSGGWLENSKLAVLLLFLPFVVKS